MTTARQAAATIAQLITATKLYAVDTSTTNPKFSDAEYIQALNWSVTELQVRLRSPPSKAIETADLTYTAEESEMEVPAGVGFQSIYQIVDVTEPDAPSIIGWGPVNQLLQPNVIAARSGALQVQRRRWTLLEGVTPNWRARIAIFPTPQRDIDLRIYYLQRALVSDATSDTFILAPEWQELVALGAAIRLRGLHNEELSPVLMQLHGDQMTLFEEQAGGYQGLQRIPRRRYGRH